MSYVQSAIALDSSSNLYFASEGAGSGWVFAMDRATRVVTRYAGGASLVSGVGPPAAYPGDGLRATSAWLIQPASLVFDAADNLYICDRYMKRVRMVQRSTRNITTVAGNENAYSSCKDEYARCGDGGPATSAYLNDPIDVAIDGANNVYIAIFGLAVRKVDASTGIISTLSFSCYGLLSDSVAGNLYCSVGSAIVVMQLSTGVVSAFAGTGAYGFTGDGGPATSASMTYASGMCTNEKNFYIAGE
jgi:hypothetical protein